MQKALARYCTLRQIPRRKMVKRVRTRWNTMYGVIRHALLLRPAINSMCLSELWRDKLGKFNPTDEQWALLERLEPVLEVGCIS
jgi:hypothetical protein